MTERTACAVQDLETDTDLLPEHTVESGEAVFSGLALFSRFQPIVSLTHRYPVGHEALLRAHGPDGRRVANEHVFAQARANGETERLDRLSLALHLRHYRAQDPGDTWLFVNVSPDVIVDGRRHGVFFGTYLKRLLAHHAFPTQRLAVEIPEVAIRDEYYLAEAVHYYRSLGCLIAIDDFGAMHSNFERIWRLRPDIVKLDRAMAVAAAADVRTRRLAENMVRLLHEAGSLVVMEGVETAEEMAAAMEADADFVQGNYLGSDEDRAVYTVTCPKLEPACHMFRERSRRQSERQRHFLASLSAQFFNAVERVRRRVELAEAARALSAQGGVRRCYLLDEDGRQLGTGVELDDRTDTRFVPLSKTAGASWFRRAYFRKAAAQPEALHWTGPYLSVTGAHMCLTLSYGLKLDGVLRVLCCDVDWPEDEPWPAVENRKAETYGLIAP